LTTLRALTELINQTVGDALSDMLLVEVILAQKEYSVKEWNATYEDMPNRLIKVLVPDKSDYATVPGTAERKLERPAGMQEKIDVLVEKYRDGRCFVRASGTEDAVRVYGEASAAYDVDDMLRNVEQLIKVTPKSS
jgi:phosphoacetylglucosamine mutase